MKHTVLLLTLAIGVLSSRQAVGQPSLGFMSVGASVGYVSPEGVDGAIGLGVFADLGRIAPQIALEPRIEYWSHSEQVFGAEASVRDMTIGARGKYFFEVPNSKLRPFAGAGLGLHFLKSEVSVAFPGFPPISSNQSDTELGLDLGGGMETSLSPKVDLHAQVWYAIVSNASQFSLRLGLSHKLGG